MENHKPKLLRVRTVPGESPELWAGFFRDVLNTPGGISEIHAETMSEREALANPKAYAAYELLDLPEPEVDLSI